MKTTQKTESRMKTKASKWTPTGTCNDSWERRYGPIRVVVYRHWPTGVRSPESYDAHILGIPNAGGTISVDISDLGINWHEKECHTAALKELDRLIKARIRSWAK